jgi:hypothetical protein
MPADITGTNIVREGEHGEKILEFQTGPISRISSWQTK